MYSFVKNLRVIKAHAQIHGGSTEEFHSRLQANRKATSGVV